jgi:hypothetical protein
MRKTSRRLPALTLALTLGLALPLGLTAGAAGAGELAGVTLPDTAKAGETSLVLNGMGLRTKYSIAKVYVAGLYLEAKQSDPAKILAEDKARRLEMQFLRDVDKGKIAEAWSECLEGNVPGASTEVQQAFKQLEGWTADMKTGHKMTFTYVPGQGTEVAVQGAVKGSAPGKPFADAIFSCWIGPVPPNADLKTGLLGQ